MKDKLRADIAAILSEVLDTVLSPEDNPQREDIPAWDSLKHMELVLRLEERFHIRFSFREVSEIQSLNDLVCIIEVKQ